MRHFLAPVLVLTLVAAPAGPAGAAEPERVAVAPGGQGFVLRPSGRPFVPYGFNYDHDEKGRLIEDYWDKEWAKVEEDFREMRDLGANTVRVHLQVGRFLESPTKARAESLERLGRLLRLAGGLGLYLDLTGLGCYHKADVPAWYDRLSEKERWEAQAVFWEAVAGRCAGSPAVFCYDLMNEPVVAGARRDDWLGGAFAGKHFVQFVNLDLAGRQRPDIARAWVGRLAAAVRKADPHHLVTVGLVDWSLDRPGLTSGFVPDRVAGDLDFLCVHLYPKQGKVDDALKTLAGFAAVGKPVVIEETFPLACGMDDFRAFMDGSRMHAAGWVGFYWGKTPAELRGTKNIGEAMLLGWLDFFRKWKPAEK